MKNLKKKKGFTLIELIVVIAILGILAAIAVPRLSGFQDSAKKKSDISNAQTIANAINIAIADGKITLSSSAFTNTSGSSMTFGSGGSAVTVANKGTLTADQVLTYVIDNYLGGTTPQPKYNSSGDFAVSVTGTNTFKITDGTNDAWPTPDGSLAD